jgi:hypothetical protein
MLGYVCRSRDRANASALLAMWKLYSEGQDFFISRLRSCLVSPRGRQHRFGRAVPNSPLQSKKGEFNVGLGPLVPLVGQMRLPPVVMRHLR